MEQKFGKFKLLKKLYTSSMAEVHVAKRPISASKEKLVLLKILRKELKTKPSFVQMFLREVKTASRLLHPNVSQILDVGFAEGNYFVASEYLQGQDLFSVAEACRKQHLLVPIPIALIVASRVCKGLQYAHSKTDTTNRPLQIVHTDINPQNIVIAFSGEIKIVDFGLAKVLSRFRDIHNASFREKPVYLSPEQIRSEQIDNRTDIFSCGVVLWEMLAGKHLYGKTSPAENFQEVIKGNVPPIQQFNPQIPRAIDRLLAKALAKDVDQRLQTALEMHEALEEILSDQQMTVGPQDLKHFMQELFKGQAESIRKIEQAQESGSLQSMLFDGLNIASEDSPALEVDQIIQKEVEKPARVPIAKMGYSYRPPEPKFIHDPNAPYPRKKIKRFRPILLLPILVLIIVAYLVFSSNKNPIEETISLFNPRSNQKEPENPISQEKETPIEMIGKITIESSPKGAVVFLNSKKQCITPCEIPKLEMDRVYQIKITKHRYRDWEGQLTLDQKHPTARIQPTLRKE